MAHHIGKQNSHPADGWLRTVMSTYKEKHVAQFQDKGEQRSTVKRGKFFLQREHPRHAPWCEQCWWVISGTRMEACFPLLPISTPYQLAGIKRPLSQSLTSQPLISLSPERVMLIIFQTGLFSSLPLQRRCLEDR